MIPTNVEVTLDKKAIREYIERRIDEEVRETFWLVDMKKLSELLCMSERYVEEMITSDVRMRAIERRKSRKRWWPYRQAMQAVEEITSEW
ncbi:hypothetical protein ACQKMN_16905 [Ureibacillus composti]